MPDLRKIFDRNGDGKIDYKDFTSLADINGDGKIDQEDIMALLDNLYGYSCNGIPNVVKPLEESCKEYIKKNGDIRRAANKVISDAVVKCTTSGFISSLGGLITLPIALPANITSVIYVQMRMIMHLAYMAGYDIHSETVHSLIYACLAGVSLTEVAKKAGIEVGEKLAIGMVKKIPAKVLQKINQKVGFKLFTKFGEKGIINIGKMVPVVGGVIGGGFDLAETKMIGDRAYKEFIEGIIS